MILSGISTKGFRNLKSETLKFSPGLNVIVGENGQGKTNLLEAIWLLSGAKSFRLAKNSQMVAFDSQGAECKAAFTARGRDNLSQFSIKNDRFKLELNYVPVKGSDSPGFAAVVFSPEHLSIIKDGPSERRDFLDTGIGQLKSRYRGVLGEYLRVMKQRNAFLKMKLGETEFNTTLDVYDMQLARLGSVIKKTRETYLSQLTPKAQEYFSQMCKGEHSLSLGYDSVMPDSAEDYASVLFEYREKDIATGSTLMGVHRDDVIVEIDGKAARLYGSQGQQRCCVLALKLAEAYLFGEFLDEPPVVLLDDVLSELDEIRRSFLLEHLEGPQIFITACDPPEEFKKRQLALFTVKDGVITAQGDCSKHTETTQH